ncbi:MAG: Ig domain-containing protein, partial [Oscillospiraceae bacterium]|nr:Ig domain-containing protein [Oscillospiraceae bacterium]
MTVTTEDGGKTATCTVTVTAAEEGGGGGGSGEGGETPDTPPSGEETSGKIVDLAGWVVGVYKDGEHGKVIIDPKNDNDPSNDDTVYYIDTNAYEVDHYNSWKSSDIVTDIANNTDDPRVFYVLEDKIAERQYTGRTEEGYVLDNETVTIFAFDPTKYYDGERKLTFTTTEKCRYYAVTGVHAFKYNPNDLDNSVIDVKLDKSEVTLKEVGATYELKATVIPDYAENKTVTWVSSDETVATVAEDGTVTAVAAGEATITVTTVDGNYTATCTVTVEIEDSKTVFSGNIDVELQQVVEESNEETGEYEETLKPVEGYEVGTSLQKICDDETGIIELKHTITPALEDEISYADATWAVKLTEDNIKNILNEEIIAYFEENEISEYNAMIAAFEGMVVEGLGDRYEELDVSWAVPYLLGEDYLNLEYTLKDTDQLGLMISIGSMDDESSEVVFTPDSVTITMDGNEIDKSCVFQGG